MPCTSICDGNLDPTTLYVQRKRGVCNHILIHLLQYPCNQTFPGKLPVVTNYAHSIYKRSTNHMHVIMTDQPEDLLIKDEASDSLQFIPYPPKLILSSRSLQEAI